MAASSRRWKTNPAAARYLNCPFQAETGADPTRSRDDEIDAEENPQNVQTGDRPMRQDHEADEEGNQPRQRHPNPGRCLLHAETQPDPHDTGYNQRGAEQEG